MATEAPPQISHILALDLSQDDATCVEICRKACTEQGFLYVTNHGIPRSLIDGFFAQMRAFFALPLEEKMKIHADKNNRGYTLMANSKLDPGNSTKGDTHEGIYFGRDIPLDDEEAKKPLHGPNQYPSEALLPGFKETTMRYHAACLDLALRIIRLLSLGLGLPEDYLGRSFTHPIALLRPLHYNATKSDPAAGQFGAGAHTDFGCVTLLMTDEVPGLQICLDGEWKDVPPSPGNYVVNLGDMLECWTNGTYKSTLHRVVNTTGRERFSAPFFINPNFEASVAPLDVCCSETNPPRFPAMTSGEYLMSKYVATHKGYAQSTGKDPAAPGAASDSAPAAPGAADAQAPAAPVAASA